MLKKLLLLILISAGSQLSAQTRSPQFADSLFPAYYHQRVSHFRTLPQTKQDIIFLGNSISDGGEWSELFNDLQVKNRGISGDITAGVLHRLDEIYNRKPAKVFLLIGTNDLARGIKADSVVRNILWIADLIKAKSPATKLYVQSIFPVNESFGKFTGHMSRRKEITEVNRVLRENAPAKHYTYLNISAALSDSTGRLNRAYTNDGLHLTGPGYLKWKELIYPAMYSVPALIPMPQQVSWSKGKFLLAQYKSIVISTATLKSEALKLQQYLKQQGLIVPIVSTISKQPHIALETGDVSSPQLKDEAYTLSVTPNKILIKANTSHGIFNAVQTFKQLITDKRIQGCEITDWPAFGWRGYMIDVGRNYQSMDLLKQQIEVMSRYKYNIFHFHFTEDIAWRLAIKKYPQLTAPETMLRNKGKFYTEADLKELIAYCKERHITLVPEIDMPGHSAAFRRAMKTDMQSEEGLQIVKNILKEFFETYDVPYIHIGADEVKITNKNFLPEVSAYIEGFGKKIIGWEPGGNFTDQTIRQLWMDDNALTSSKASIQFIDSRHLYLNHMDPLESVVTIFNRKIAGREKGDPSVLGGTICMWPDRRVENGEDVLEMNPVYPAMLAFAERSWQGGGQPKWVANIGEPDQARTQEYIQFEDRLLNHKDRYFSRLPFPYVKQSETVWNLYGPYANSGTLAKEFEPETNGFDINTQPVLQTVGGTVILRHWWANLIDGALEQPGENSTWYATTRIWSDEEGIKDFWIGFNNLSRSPATDSPMPGTWDNHQSKVWVNGNLIDPPKWRQGGMKGNSEVPLVDEGYEYREPTKILLRKGWNEVLIKAPIGSFKGKDWQNPEKWMFTFIRTN